MKKLLPGTQVEFHVLPKDFGQGWASGNAIDLIRVIFGFVCLNDHERSKFIHSIVTSSSSKINVRTVDRIIKEVFDENSLESLQ